VKLPLVGFILNSLTHPGQDNSLKAQAVRQVLSGTTATLMDLVSFKIALILGVHPMIAAVISFCFGTATNFTITRYYVFAEVERQRKRTSAQFVIYLLTCFVSLGIVQAFILVFHFQLGLDPLLAKVLAIPVMFVWTVLSGRFLVFDKS
jgi:putative flippase GtrA